MKAETFALLAGGVAAVLLLARRPKATPDPGYLDRITAAGAIMVERVDQFFDESYNYALYGHPAPGIATIPGGEAEARAHKFDAALTWAGGYSDPLLLYANGVTYGAPRDPIYDWFAAPLW